MVTILTAFLGLVLGVHAVELSVEGDVASVELLLDGRPVATLTEEPWVAEVDFGDELTPHELVAITRNSERVEIGRAERRINLPQARSQAELVFRSGGGEDGASARAGGVWRSVDAEQPDAWQVTLDGAPLEIADPADFPLPQYDTSSPHVLEAALQFGRSVARTELVFGGSATGTTRTELTALVFDLGRGKTPTVAEMRGWFSWQGRPIEVVAVERGGADIVSVHEATPRAWGILRKLRRGVLESTDPNPLKRRLSSGLHEEDRLRVILPIAEGDSSEVTQFHLSSDFSRIEYGPTSSGATRQEVAGSRAYGFLASFPYPEEGPLSSEAPRQTAAAVAIAAQVAAAANRARAVVLVHEVGTADQSRFTPQLVRRYLDRLQVPLFVWSIGGDGKDTTWGPAQTFTSSEKFLRASLALREALDRQVVVWIRGRHLPDQIELSTVASARLRSVSSGP